MSMSDGPFKNVQGDREPPPPQGAPGITAPIAGGNQTAVLVQGLQGAISSLPALIREGMVSATDEIMRAQQSARFGGTAAQSAAMAGGGGINPGDLARAVTEGFLNAQGLYMSSMLGGGMLVQGMGPGTQSGSHVGLGTGFGGRRQRHDTGQGGVPDMGDQGGPPQTARTPPRAPGGAPGTAAPPAATEPSAAPEPVTPGTMRPEAAHRTAGAGPTSGMGENEGYVQPQASPASAIRRGLSYDLQTLRSDIGRTAGRALSQVRIGRQYQQDENGAWRQIGPNGSMSVSGIVQDEQGGWRTAGPHGSMSTSPAPASDIRAVQRAQTISNVTGVVKGALGGIGSDGGALGGGLDAMSQAGGGYASAAKGIGAGVGIAAGGFALAREGGSFIADQRAANAEYQRITGGSNLSGFGQRAASEMYGLRSMFGMGSANAQRLYLGTKELGLSGEDQNTALSNAQHWFNKFGTTVEESMQILETASQTGQESLAGVSSALDAVTKSAKAAGVNTDVARQNFTRLFSTASETFGGPQSAGIAGALGAANAGLGRPLQNLDTSGLMSDSALRMQAMQQGYGSLNQYLAAGRRGANGLTGAQVVAKAQTQQVQSITPTILGTGGMNTLAQYGKSHPMPSGGYSQVQIDDLATQLENSGAMDTEAAIQLLSAPPYSISGLTSENVWNYLAQVELGKWNPLAEAKSQAQQNAPSKMTPGQRSSAQAGASGKRSGGLLKTNFYAQDLNNLKNDVQSIPVFGHFFGSKTKSPGKPSAAMKAYDKFALGFQGGTNVPILQQAASNKDIANAQFEVQTGGGQRVVSYEDLLKYYSDQAREGGVQIMSGKDAGTTLASALGMPEDTGVKITTDISAASSAAGKAGQSLEQYQKQHPVKGGPGVNKITIEPAPALAALLRISPSGPLFANAQQNLTPPSPFMNPQNFPGANALAGVGGSQTNNAP